MTHHTDSYYKKKLEEVTDSADLLDTYFNWYRKKHTENQLGAIQILELGIENDSLSIADKFQLAAQLMRNYNGLGSIQEGFRLSERFYHILLPSEHISKELIANQSFRMLFHAQKGKNLQAVTIGEETMQLINQSKTHDDCDEFLEVYRLTGAISASLGYTDKAFLYLNKAKDLAENNEFYQKGLPIVYGSLGDVYREAENWEKAQKYYGLGAALCKQKNNKMLLPIFLRMQGVMATKLQQFAIAKKYLDEALDATQWFQEPRTHAYILQNMAELNIAVADIDSFHELKERIVALPFYAENDNFQSEMDGLTSKAYLVLNEPKVALQYADKWEEKVRTLNDLSKLKIVYEHKISLYEQLKQYEEVVKYYELLFDTTDKLINDKNNQLLAEFASKFEHEKKEKELQTLKLESVNLQLQSLRAQMNPHFVFNTIGAISQDLKEENIEQSKALLHSFARMIQSNVSFINQDKITLTQEVRFLNDYLVLEQNRLGNRLQFKINNSSNDGDVLIPSMLIQPYVENAVKHGIMPLQKEGRITIDFERQNEMMICTITDNGVGRKQAAVNKQNSNAHLGKSTSINATRLQLLNQSNTEKLHVNYTDLTNKNDKSTGTKVQLYIPI